MMIWWGLLNIFKYLLCWSKNMLSVFNFHGKASGKKQLCLFFFFFLVISLVKFRNLKKGIAKKLQRDPIFELLLVLSAHEKKHVGKQAVVCCGSRSAARGDLHSWGLLCPQEGVDGRRLLICTSLSLLAVRVPKHVFERETLQVPFQCLAVPFQLCSRGLFFFRNFLDFWSFSLTAHLSSPPCLPFLLCAHRIF